MLRKKEAPLSSRPVQATEGFGLEEDYRPIPTIDARRRIEASGRSSVEGVGEGCGPREEVVEAPPPVDRSVRSDVERHRHVYCGRTLAVSSRILLARHLDFCDSGWRRPRGF
ncbi:hypothetical protein NL676_036146 [Syzygium grande]|nr:hypothetical protein NL676_036146 [Syzygium grande]